MSLAEILNLTIAFRRIQQDKRDDVWPDIVGYRDYDRELDGNLQNLRDQLENTISYRASLPLGIEIPKRGFTLRPGIVPLIDDRLLYQAIADLYAPHFNAESCVYSNRLTSYPNSNRMFLPGVELWLAFQDKVEQFCDECPYVVETDITAYFDHINHDLLIHRIDDLFQSSIDKATLRESKQVLQRLLQRWSTGFYRFGIPQVNDASSFFGNMYLDELDKWMSRRGYVFLRYVDDIRIFTKDEPGARRALVDLIIKLREMGLYLAAGKTKIEESAEVSERLGQERHEIKTIETELDSGVKERIEGATHLLEDFFIRLVEDPNQFNDRHFRYCINRFKKAKASNLGEEIHNRVIEEIVKRFTSMPQSTDVFVDYLSLFPDNEDLQISVLDFLESPYNLYPWQEMLLLEFLIRSNISRTLIDHTMTFARRVVLGQNHSACREKGLIILGKNGDYADRREIRALYNNEPRAGVRRSIIVSIQEMHRGERDNFYNDVSRDFRSVQMAVEYVKALPNPTYHYFNPPSGFDLIDTYDSDDLDDLGSEYFL